MKRIQFTAIFLAFSLCLAASAALAQKGEPKLRTVHGTVINKDDSGVPSAVVYLKNNRTQATQTHFSDDGGRFRFSGLDPNVDYEIHAESGDLTSATRTISSFDSRKDIDVTLKLDKTKKKTVS